MIGALPERDGLVAARNIRTLPAPAGGVPIIACADDESTARAAGMNLYLCKPVNPQALAEALGSLVVRF